MRPACAIRCSWPTTSSAAIAWGVGLTFVVYHLAGVPFVEAHLELMVLVIACLSVLPVAASVLRAVLARGGAEKAG